MISLELLVTGCTSVRIAHLPRDTQFHTESRPLLLPCAVPAILPFSAQYSATGEQLVICMLNAMGTSHLFKVLLELLLFYCYYFYFYFINQCTAFLPWPQSS